MKNKKGFTLVELLAVLVVLLVIVLIAMNVINSRVKEAKKNTVEVNANNYIKAVNGVAALSQNIGEDMEKGTYQVRDLNKTDIKINGEKPRKGFLLIDNYEVTIGCLMYKDYSALIVGGKTSSVEKMNCNDFAIDKEFAYKGSEETFLASVPGTYKVEAWGASGGDAGPSNDFVSGGYGGYSVGYVYLDKGEKLYVNVGGKGANGVGNVEYADGGYNGGGRGARGGRDGRYSGGGGGATSIAFQSGLLSNLSNNKNKVLMVAGGGGGSWSYPDNHGFRAVQIGHAGGYVANSCVSTHDTVVGGSQTTGYSFGTANSSTTGESSGGGGGYWGGNSGTFCGAGGSGYIANPRLLNRKMYCYNCTSSTSYSTETNTVTCASDDPTENCAKIGNGYAKITYVSSSKVNSDILPLYGMGNEVTDITGGWTIYEGEYGKSNKLSDSLQLTYSAANGDTTSQFITKNLIDTTGYNYLNVIYEIVGTENWGQYSSLWVYAGPTVPQVVEDWTIYSGNTARGTYQTSLNISSLNNAYIYLMDSGVNIKIYHVWLSK